jgi:uncharacterized membrane protein
MIVVVDSFLLTIVVLVTAADIIMVLEIAMAIAHLLKSIMTLELVPCHRKKERSYVIKGKQFPICARCTSILLGYLFVPILLILGLKISIIIGILANIPMITDGYTQLRKWRMSNNFLRTATGLLSGFGQSVIIVWLAKTLVELLS